MAHHASLFLIMPVRCLCVALVIVGAVSTAAAQPSATIVAIEGATTTYHSIDRHGEVVTVQVPSHSNQVKVRTPAGQTIVLAMPPAALRSMQIGDAFTFTVPAPPR